MSFGEEILYYMYKVLQICVKNFANYKQFPLHLQHLQK